MEKPKLGIPRALFYYNFYPLWKEFFTNLGVEVILSSPTSKLTLKNGSSICVDDACLPVKIFFGHVLNLIGKVDYLFIPRYTSISEKEYVCPKIGGLPDMIKHNINNLPTVISTEINLRKQKKDSLEYAIDIGKYFCTDIVKIKNAYKLGTAKYRKFRNAIKTGIIPTDILEKHNSLNNIHSNSNKNILNIVVMGHSYIVYDRFLNMNILKKLEGFSCNIITMEMLDQKLIIKNAKSLNKKMFWYYGTKITGSTKYFINKPNIDGIIFLTSFGCGIDSFSFDLAQRYARNSSIPYTLLSLDEHSGEAGLDTRIEAFIDMIKWRNSYDSNLSAYGKYIHFC